MKKITLVLCAMLMVLGVNANVRQIRRAAEANPTQITLQVNRGYLYNWEGTTDDRFNSGVAPKGIMRLELGVTQGEGDDFQFKKNLIAYFYNSGDVTALNGVHSLGIYYNEEVGYLYDNIVDIKGNGNQADIIGMEGLYLQASVIAVENGMKVYDLYFISQQYEFSVQVPVIGINNVVANADPSAENAFFTPSDQTFFMNEATADFEYNFADLEIGYDPTYAPNIVRVSGYNEGQSYIVLDFVVSVIDANTYIPAGTYTISDSGEAETVVKSKGFLAADPLPSVALTYDAEGYADKYWFLSEGTAVVESDGTELRVTVEAKNAYGKSVKAVIGTLSTGINEINANVKAEKAIENGQLVIIRNGVRYNAQGAVVE